MPSVWDDDEVKPTKVDTTQAKPGGNSSFPMTDDNPMFNLIKGIGGGVITTGSDLWNLIRKVAGDNQNIPTAPGATPSTSKMESLGRGIEGVGEYALPAGEITKGIEGAGAGVRMLAQGGLGGLFGAIHGQGDPSRIASDAALGAGGELLPILGGVLGKRAAAGASGWYQKLLDLPQSVSIDDAEKTAQMGLEGKFAIGNKGAIKTLGNASTRGTVLGDLNGAVEDAMKTPVNPGIQALALPGQTQLQTAGGQPTDMGEVLRPLRDRINELRGSTGKLKNPTTEGEAYEKTLRNELMSTWNNWGGNLTNKFPELSVEEAHNAKKELYNQISSRQYSDVVDDATIGAKKEAQELLARGLKNSVNKAIPEVATYNEGMHHAIMLQDALKKAYKANPSEMDKVLTGLTGGTMLGMGALGMGTGHAGGTMLTGSALGVGSLGLLSYAARKAVTDPATGSRLAILFHSNPKILEALGGLSRSGIWGAHNLFMQGSQNSGGGTTPLSGNAALDNLFKALGQPQ